MLIYGSFIRACRQNLIFKIVRRGLNLCDKRLTFGLLGVGLVLHCVCMYMKSYTLINGCQTFETSCFT